MIAGSTSSSSNNKTELLDTSTWSWTRTLDHPSNSKGNCQTNGEMVYLYPHFYIIGGLHDKFDSIGEINRFDEFERIWTFVGQLAHPRQQFSAILHEPSYTIMIYGGQTSYKDEENLYNVPSQKCVIQGDTVVCTEQQPTLDGTTLPYVFLVEDDFCRGIAPGY